MKKNTILEETLSFSNAQERAQCLGKVELKRRDLEGKNHCHVKRDIDYGPNQMKILYWTYSELNADVNAA